MPISNSKKFIFIHIPKNAGTSVSHLLKPHIQDKGRHNIYRRLTSNIPFREPVQSVCIRGHDSARWIRTKIGHKLFNDYYKFSIVRDPYTRAISAYEYMKQRTEHKRNRIVSKMTFEDFLCFPSFTRSTQASMVVNAAGALMVDKLIRLENIETELAEVLSRLKINERLDPKPLNTSKHKPLEQYMTPTNIARINTVFACDFDLFGYPKQ